MIKKLIPATEFQYTSNGKKYYKVYVQRSDGSMVKGTRTLNSYTGNRLEQVIKDMQRDIDNGAWANKIDGE